MAWRVLHAELDVAIPPKRICACWMFNAFPWIGPRAIDEIKAPELLAIIRRAEERGLLDTAHRLLHDGRRGVPLRHCHRPL